MDTDYMELFGLEPEGGNEQEVADPATGTEGAGQAQSEQPGENEQGVADPANHPIGTASLGSAGDPGEGDGLSVQEPAGDEGPGEEDGAREGNNPAQSTEENRKYAAARRKAEAERDRAVAQARAEAGQEADRLIAGLKLQDPVSKKPITNREELAAYQEHQRAQQLQQKTGMNQEQYQAFVDSLPEVQEAKAVKAQAARDQAKAEIDRQIGLIGAMEPGVKSLEDLTKQDCFPQLYAMAKKGYAISDAWKLLHMDSRVESAAAAAQQAARNQMAGKAHLSRTATRGNTTLEVPADVKEQYRLFNPEATDAEIAAHYNRSHKH